MTRTIFALGSAPTLPATTASLRWAGGKLGMERLKRQLDASRRLVRNPLSRVAYLEQGDEAWLFVNGSAYRTSLSMACRLGDNNRMGYQDLRGILQQPDDASLLIRLIGEGHWFLEEG